MLNIFAHLLYFTQPLHFCIFLYILTREKHENESLSASYLEFIYTLFNLLYTFFLFTFLFIFSYIHNACESPNKRNHAEKYINFGKWRRKIPMPLIPFDFIMYNYKLCGMGLFSCVWKIFQKYFLTRSLKWE